MSIFNINESAIKDEKKMTYAAVITQKSES